MRRLKAKLQELKHELLVLRHTKRYERLWEPMRVARQRIAPPAIDSQWFASGFLSRSIPEPVSLSGFPLPRVIRLCWTGNNPMSPTRKQRLEEFQRKNADVEVELITPQNWGRYEVPSHPFHPAFMLLSYTHRADYLRAYLLYHHGGGYSDIKRPKRKWSPAFERLEASEKWVSGYPEIDRYNISEVPPMFGRIWDFSGHLIGQGGIIARAGNPLIGELLQEMEQRLDRCADRLAGLPIDAQGHHPDYPLRWGELLGEIWYPLQIKYKERLLRDRALALHLRHYR